MNGILNYAFDFFYNWLFGGQPSSYFEPFAQGIAGFVSLFFVLFMAWFCFKLCTALIRLVYYMISG